MILLAPPDLKVAFEPDQKPEAPAADGRVFYRQRRFLVAVTIAPWAGGKILRRARPV
jgi:hypothetical protein